MYHLNFSDLKDLKKYYMPFIKNGGIFITTKNTHGLGEKISLQLKLPETHEKYQVDGSVVWINPEFAQQGREQGIGIQFESENNLILKNKIEKLLVGVNSAGKPATM